MTGGGEVRRVRIDPAVVDPADVELLEDLIARRPARRRRPGAGPAGFDAGRPRRARAPVRRW